MKWDRSEELYEVSQHVIPGGVNSPVRAFRRVGRNPIFIQKAKGPYLYDVDGNQYIDYVCSWGANILGHSYPDVIRAVKSTCDNGLTFGAPTKLEYQLASLISQTPDLTTLGKIVGGGMPWPFLPKQLHGMTRKSNQINIMITISGLINYIKG